MVLAGAVQRPQIGDGRRAYLGVHRDRIAAFGGRGLRGTALAGARQKAILT
jgi:hypothetical protein